MKIDSKRLLTKAVTVTALFCMTTQTTFAALLNLAQEPLAAFGVPPKVMLTISKDQQLYKKAYNDYSDLDGDGTIETTYKQTIEYYGYFDPYKCYDYVSNRFEPVAQAAIIPVLNARGEQTGVRPDVCGGSRWSGNFLNWVSTSRIDAVRKLLYGGLRSTDETFIAGTRENPITVLERSYLPTDAHAWAKHYVPNPATPTETPPIDRLTPFATPVTTPVEALGESNTSFTLPSSQNDVTIRFTTAMTHVRLGDQVMLQSQFTPSHFIRAVVVAIGSGNTRFTLRFDPPSDVKDWGQGKDHTQWRFINLSSTGLSFCNLTTGSTAAGDANALSQTNTNPPIIRVARGNFGLWNANEKWQCYWFEERSFLQNGFVGGTRSNGNRMAVSDIAASSENPIQSEHGLGTGLNRGEYVVRVRVCDPKLQDSLNRESCKRYPNGNLKPVGLLQQYGDDGGIHFGLMTGSHVKNISGGVLRKNAQPMSDEVRVNLDGAFQETNLDKSIRLDPYRPRGGTRSQSSPASPPGIVNTLNYMRIYGYQYTDGSYSNASGDTCTFQLTSISENTCTSWGNPMSEIFFEAVRYFAGNPKTKAYSYAATDSTKDNQLGLPIADFVDPITSKNYCANMNVLVVNASVSDNEEDLGGISAKEIRGAGTVSALTDVVGGHEGIDGKFFFTGKILGDTASTDPGFELCTAKNVKTLGAASGICPEGPTTGGSYHIAGLAHHAKTNHIRDVTALVPGGLPPHDKASLKVTTYAVQLSSNTPQLEIRGGADQRVVIQPIYRLDLRGVTPSDPFGGGGLVDMRYVRIDNSDPNRKTGKVYVNWEDSEQGGDYDQDMWGTLEWVLDVAAKTITITTNAVSASTRNPQGFGYSISGTTQDGPHFHSGIYGFYYPTDGSGVDSTGARGCINCNLVGSGGQTSRQSVTYKLDKPNAANILKDPLWYAAKYGGFDDTNADGKPDSAAEWDRVNNVTNLPGADGMPDNYFLVTNPLKLADALRAAFAKISGDSSGTAVIANSTQLSTTSAVYQARFNGTEWSGQFVKVKAGVKPDGSPDIGTVGTGTDAGKQIPTAANRLILTLDDVTTRDGVLFEKDSISANLLLELNKSPSTGAPDGLGLDRLEWLRGDPSKEVRKTGSFRDRNSTVLGDIANSDPTYVGAPNTPRFERSYADFVEKYFRRRPMIYVGANDGMVHGFDADTMVEKVAYVPSKLHPELAKLTSPDYAHRFYVDGPTESADAVVNSAWRTVLVGGLGAGGQGIYALDVTDPTEFTRGNAANIVMWEFNDTDDADLGYTYGKPVIRQMSDGRFAAIVSGGYNNSQGDSATSATGRAYLFIIFLDGPGGANRTWRPGIDYIKIDTGEGTVASPNGLASPFVADINADGKADLIYAGDLFGNMWKFDVRSRTIGNWMLPENRLKLFVAKEGADVQPITSAADGTLHPSGQGFIIAFGTGKYLEGIDLLPANFRKQSYYGIWDQHDKTVISDQATVPRDKLFERTITGTRALRFVEVSKDRPNWTSGAAQDLGWFMNFPDSETSGERVVFRPLLFSSRLIFTTLIPTDELCAGGGTSIVMIVNPITGGPLDTAVFNTDDKPNVLDANDQIGGKYVSGVQSTVGITPTPVVVRGAPAQNKESTNSKIYGTESPYLAGQGGTALGFTFLGGPLGITGMWIGLSADSGRVSWREIITN